MSRTCARQGCDRIAVATLSYNYAEGVVWVDDLAPEAHPMVHDLCEQHADDLRVPRGWERRDGRTRARSGSGASAGAADAVDGSFDLRLPLKTA